MIGKPTSRKPAPSTEVAEEAITETEIEQSLTERRPEIEAKLADARQSILRGDIAPLEPLPALLRIARRNAKGSR
jgi:hypothetical protein